MSPVMLKKVQEVMGLLLQQAVAAMEVHVTPPPVSTAPTPLTTTKHLPYVVMASVMLRKVKEMTRLLLQQAVAAMEVQVPLAHSG